MATDDVTEYGIYRRSGERGGRKVGRGRAEKGGREETGEKGSVRKPR